MSRLHSSAPMLLLRRRSSSTSTSLPSHRAPHVALAAATERARFGTLSPEEAHELFDELLQQATPVPERALNGFLAALARAPAPATCSDGLSLVVALFSRMSRGHGPPVASPTVHTYSILLDCCCRARQPDLALAFFGCFLRAGFKGDEVIINTLLKVLCHAKRTDEAADVLLHRITHLGCVPNAISYNTVIKGLCDGSRSQHALELLRMMAKQEAGCSPDVVSYTTVIPGFLKEGKFSMASNLFHEMVQQGVVPDVVTYNSMIDVLCKRGRSKEARQILDCAILKSLKPNIVTYSTMLHGILIYAHAKCGLVDEAFLIFEDIQKQGMKPNVVTYSAMIDAFCGKGRMNDAIEQFNQMIDMGVRPDVQTYRCLIQGYCTHGHLGRAKELVYEMMEKSIGCPGVVFFNSIMNNLCKEGRVTDAQDIFDFMKHIGEKPNVITFNSLIDGYCLVGKMQIASSLEYMMIWYRLALSLMQLRTIHLLMDTLKLEWWMLR
ncbi:protein Rf1, mitochondrial-like [Lolium rigidum]|uniref:protein Rf1, mitochondrial-like n=1 Tax=Lolium rigidum TaxID=89674 RepID=UPI001F5C6D3D|nr:protein Rf1, mitochondrial-like [Lolium rigidum]